MSSPKKLSWIKACAALILVIVTGLSSAASTSGAAAHVTSAGSLATDYTLPYGMYGNLAHIRATGIARFGYVDINAPSLYSAGPVSFGAPIAWTDSGLGHGFGEGPPYYDRYLAIAADGSLRAFDHNGDWILNETVVTGATGWGAVRSLSYSGRSSLVYGLRGSALVRYAFRESADSLATSYSNSRVIESVHWSGAKLIACAGTATVNGRKVDVIYVVTYGGGLNMYTVDQATNALHGYRLRTTGWQNITALNATRWVPTWGVTFVGVMNGSANIYYDPVSDARGDIVSYGVATLGMAGTLQS